MNKAIPISKLLFCIMFTNNVFAEKICTYSTYKWNVYEGVAKEFKRIEKPFAALTQLEIDPHSGCSVCEQDQQNISYPGLKSFSVCYKIAQDFERALDILLQSNAPINNIVGYRVGMTRGEVDHQGNRTGFSNHSFGIAVDINSEHNGLYDNCIEINPNCRLIKGGVWQPGRNKFSLSADGMIVKQMKQVDFKWGGEISGKQKDFMHFSLTGY